MKLWKWESNKNYIETEKNILRCILIHSGGGCLTIGEWILSNMDFIAMTVNKWDLLELHTANVTLEHSVFIWFSIHGESLGTYKNCRYKTFWITSIYYWWKLTHLNRRDFMWHWRFLRLFWRTRTTGNIFFVNFLLFVRRCIIFSNSFSLFSHYANRMYCTYMLLIVRCWDLLFTMDAYNLNMALLVVQ